MNTVTMDQIEWRDSEIEDTVRFLTATNPKGYSAEGIKAHAYRAFADGGFKPTFVGTAGWYVSIVPKRYDAEKPWIALVSIMAYSACRAIAK